MTLMTLPSVREFCVHTFLSDPLSSDSVVVDLGANRGEFSQAIVRAFGCVVHAVEPVPSLLEQIEETNHIIKHQLCIGSQTGTTRLTVPRAGDARLASLAHLDYGLDQSGHGEIVVPARPLEDFLAEAGIANVDLLKVDIEGAEVDVLLSTPPHVLRQIDQITVEFHDWLWPATNRIVERVIQRLRSLRFRCIRFSRTNGDVLFVRRELLGPFASLYVSSVIKYSRGLSRVLKRNIEPVIQY